MVHLLNSIYTSSIIVAHTNPFLHHKYFWVYEIKLQNGQTWVILNMNIICLYECYSPHHMLLIYWRLECIHWYYSPGWVYLLCLSVSRWYNTSGCICTTSECIYIPSYRSVSRVRPFFSESVPTCEDVGGHLLACTAMNVPEGVFEDLTEMLSKLQSELWRTCCCRYAVSYSLWKPRGPRMFAVE